MESNLLIDGMQSDYTYSIIIDENNKIWFGTYNGISIYDGQDIKSYNYDGIPNDFILKDYLNITWATFGYVGWKNKGIVKWKNGKINKFLVLKKMVAI